MNLWRLSLVVLIVTPSYAIAASSTCLYAASELISHVPGAIKGKEYGSAIEIKGPIHDGSYQCGTPPGIPPFIDMDWEGSQKPNAKVMDFIVASGAELLHKPEKLIRTLTNRCLAPTYPRHADHDNLIEESGVHIDCSSEANNADGHPDGSVAIGPARE